MEDGDTLEQRCGSRGPCSCPGVPGKNHSIPPFKSLTGSSEIHPSHSARDPCENPAWRKRYRISARARRMGRLSDWRLFSAQKLVLQSMMYHAERLPERPDVRRRGAVGGRGPVPGDLQGNGSSRIRELSSGNWRESSALRGWGWLAPAWSR